MDTITTSLLLTKLIDNLNNAPEMLSFGEFMAVLVLLGGIVAVWVQAKTDIAKIQARIADMYERSLHMERMIGLKADRSEIEHLFADLTEMKQDIKTVLQRTAKLKCEDE